MHLNHVVLHNLFHVLPMFRIFLRVVNFGHSIFFFYTLKTNSVNRNHSNNELLLKLLRKVVTPSKKLKLKFVRFSSSNSFNYIQLEINIDNFDNQRRGNTKLRLFDFILFHKRFSYYPWVRQIPKVEFKNFKNHNIILLIFFC